MNSKRIVLNVAIASGLVCLTAACGNGGTPTEPQASLTGALIVSLGFGAPNQFPAPCTGDGTVTITPQNVTGTVGGTQQEKAKYAYSGVSSTTDTPACRATVTFSELATGTWRVDDGVTACVGTVLGGNSATVKLWNSRCQ
jgi:hypothetical protein